MEIKVKITEVHELESGTGKNDKQWQKLTFVGETEGEYTKRICFTAWNQSVIDAITPNETYNLSIEVESREFNDRWYTDVKVWKAEII